MGKSRLIWEFVQSSATDGWRVMEASAVSYGASTPYLPIRALLAGYFGGVADAVLMRVVDGLLSFTPLVLAIAFIAVLGLGLQNVVLALA